MVLGDDRLLHAKIGPCESRRQSEGAVQAILLACDGDALPTYFAASSFFSDQGDKFVAAFFDRSRELLNLSQITHLVLLLFSSDCPRAHN